jgi:aryl-alcohol dehydrogenase-like predicted oxidoreductase
MALKKAGWLRDSYIVSSKVMHSPYGKNAKPTQGLSRKHVFEACHQAMKRLQVDYLDLYFCHRPDPEVLIDETVRAHDGIDRAWRSVYRYFGMPAL